jgi:hypothetical protein
MIRQIRIAAMLAAATMCCGNLSARIQRIGPASGGDLEASEVYQLEVGEAITSSEFRKLDCSIGATLIGRDRYYTCSGKVFKRDMVNGKLLYIVVPAVPY